MSVIAKFMCTKIVAHAAGHHEIELHAVKGGAGEDAENERFWKATPAGKVELTIDAEGAAKQFEPGAHYFLTFEKAAPPATTEE